MKNYTLLIILNLFSLTSYTQLTIKTYSFPTYVPMSKSILTNIEKFDLNIEHYNSSKQLLYKTFYINKRVFDSTSYSYDTFGRLLIEEKYENYNKVLKKTGYSKLIYNHKNKIDSILFYDNYGYRSFDKYYYIDTFLQKIETYNSDNIIITTNIYKKYKTQLVTVRKISNGQFEQINRETFDSKGHRIKLELNFSPKNELDTFFTKTIKYSFYSNGLIEKEDNLKYEYFYDKKQRWIFKKTSKSNNNIACEYRVIE